MATVKTEQELREELASLVTHDINTNPDNYWYGEGFRAGIQWALGEGEWMKDPEW